MAHIISQQLVEQMNVEQAFSKSPLLLEYGDFKIIVETALLQIDSYELVGLDENYNLPQTIKINN